VEIGADNATSTTSATTDQLVITTNVSTSKPITGETRYTLSCIDLNGTPQTKTATVRIIPPSKKSDRHLRPVTDEPCAGSVCVNQQQRPAPSYTLEQLKRAVS
jgi:hypothetical protein